MTTLEVENLVIYKKNANQLNPEKDVLIARGLTATFESGKLNAIMGPNGSGKTTMLTAIFGMSDKTTRTSGKILLDGKPRTPSDWYRRTTIVEQQALFPIDVTLRQALQFSLDLKNAKRGTRDTIDSLNDLLDNLNLGKLLDRKVDVFSGGEKQRAAIAIEITMDKEILILDEPTSDLDSHLALNLIHYLKNIAQTANKMVIFTIHQPSDLITKQFDNLLFIGKGCSLYSGPIAELDDYLAQHRVVRPEDWTISDFILDAFYNESKTKEISDQKEEIAAFLDEKYRAAEEIVKVSKATNKSTIFSVLDFNFAEIYVLVKKYLIITFATRPFYYKASMVLLGEALILTFFSLTMGDLDCNKCYDLKLIDGIPIGLEPWKADINDPGTQKALVYVMIKQCKEWLKGTPPAGADVKAGLALAKIAASITMMELEIEAYIISTLLLCSTPFSLFDDITLPIKEMSVAHYSPLSFVIAAILVDLVVYTSFALFHLLFLWIVPLSQYTPFINLIRMVLGQMVLPITVGFFSALCLALGAIPMQSRMTVKVGVTIVAYPVAPFMGIILQTAEVMTQKLYKVVKILISVLHIGLPIIPISGALWKKLGSWYISQGVKYEKLSGSSGFDPRIWNVLCNLLIARGVSIMNEVKLFPFLRLTLPMAAVISVFLTTVIMTLLLFYVASPRISLNP